MVGTGTAGTTGIPPAPSSVTGLGVVHRLYFYRLNLFSFSTKNPRKSDHIDHQICYDRKNTWNFFSLFNFLST